MMRSASAAGGAGAAAAGGAGAAPVGSGGAAAPVSDGGGFCANAFDAIMRGIPTQAARVMRRNPNLEGPTLFMGFLLLFEVRVFSKLSHHCYNSEQATKKNRGEWQDFFLLFGKIFLKSPPTTRPLHFETTPIEIKTISCIRCDAARDTGIAISTDSLVSPGKCAEPR